MNPKLAGSLMVAGGLVAALVIGVSTRPKPVDEEGAPDAPIEVCHMRPKGVALEQCSRVCLHIKGLIDEKGPLCDPGVGNVMRSGWISDGGCIEVPCSVMFGAK